MLAESPHAKEGATPNSEEAGSLVGRWVCVCGLQSRPELNGVMGKAV